MYICLEFYENKKTFMKYIICIFSIFLTPIAYACDLEQAKQKVILKQIEDHKDCKLISASFPKEVSSNDPWVYVDPYPRLEVKRNGQIIIDVPLQIEPAENDGYLTTSFCLAADFISESVIKITYEETSKGTITKEDGTIMYPVSSCIEQIVIDNIDKLLERSAP